MNFDFSEEQKLLKQTAADYLEEHSPLSVCRQVLESDIPYAQSLWKGAAEMGWLGTAIPEEYGGAGFGHLELAVIAEEIGRAVAPIPFSSSVYLATEALLAAGSEDQKQKWLPKLADGAVIGTVATAEKAGQSGAVAGVTRLEGGALHGEKLPVVDGDVADFAIVSAADQGGVSLALVELGGEGVTRTALESIDPSRSVAKLGFSGAPAEVLGTPGQGAALADRILNRAAVLMAFEQLGGAERALQHTLDFTQGRYAFGRPIASFQAIKHRLADAWCETELARSNCFYGAWALEHDNAELPTAACLARVAATHAYDLISVENVHMHGGVGFTWEYDCQLFYRRARLLAAQLGPVSAWREKLVQQIAA